MLRTLNYWKIFLFFFLFVTLKQELCAVEAMNLNALMVNVYT